MRTNGGRLALTTAALIVFSAGSGLGTTARAAPDLDERGPDVAAVELLEQAIEVIEVGDDEAYQALVDRAVNGSTWLPDLVIGALLDQDDGVLDFWIDILDEDDIDLYSWGSVFVAAERTALNAIPVERRATSRQNDDIRWADDDGVAPVETLEHRRLPVPPRARIALSSLDTPDGIAPDDSVYHMATRAFDDIYMSGDPFATSPAGEVVTPQPGSSAGPVPSDPPAPNTVLSAPVSTPLATQAPAEIAPAELVTPTEPSAPASTPAVASAETASQSGNSSSNTLMIITLGIAVVAMLLGLGAALRGRRHDRLADIVFIDGLTGLPNRRRMDADVAEKVASNARPTATLMIDVDHFKRFNDTHGHALGDEVLRLVGATLGRQFRRTDVPYRYGGEEFCVLLPETSEGEALQAGERIRAAIAAIELPVDERITVSIGVSIGPASEISETIERADGALYTAKENGRNQVVLA